LNSDSPRFRFLTIYFGVVAIFAALIAVVQIAVDPFDIWNTGYLKQYTHLKTGQLSRESISKPLQFASEKPDVVFLGNSRACFGVPPEWPAAPTLKVYNLSLQAATMGECRDLVDFAISTHKPKTIVLFLNTVILGNAARHATSVRDPGYNTRLRMLRRSSFFGFVQAVKETIYSADSFNASVQTIKHSRVVPPGDPLFLRGWFKKYGDRTWSRGAYLDDTWKYNTTLHRAMTLQHDSLKELRRIIRTTKRHGIELIIVFEPESADFQLSIAGCNRWDQFNEMKQAIADLHDFWDFSTINRVTGTRAYYMDASHYRGAVGRLMLHRLSGTKTGLFEQFGKRISSKTVAAHLEATKAEMEKWKITQSQLFRFFQSNQQTVDEAAFKNQLNAIIRI